MATSANYGGIEGKIKGFPIKVVLRAQVSTEGGVRR